MWYSGALTGVNTIKGIAGYDTINALCSINNWLLCLAGYPILTV